MGRFLTGRRLNRRISGLLFDLDGTLVNSESLHFDSTSQILSRRGLTLAHADFDIYAGWEENACWIHLNARFGHIGKPKELTAERTAAFLELLRRRELPVLPGVVALLSWARRRHLPMAVASSLPRDQIDAALEAARLGDFFDIRMSGHDDVALGRGKPAPDVYLAAASALGVNPYACVAVEDSPTGMKSARAAGAYVIAVTGPIADDCCDADYACSTMIDALGLLRRHIE